MNLPTKTFPITQDQQRFLLKIDLINITRPYKHNNSFKYKSKQNATELSNFIQDQKRKNSDVLLEWSMPDKAKPYSPGSRNHMLCLTEKYHVLVSRLNLLEKFSLFKRLSPETKMCQFQSVDMKTNITFQTTTAFLRSRLLNYMTFCSTYWTIIYYHCTLTLNKK